MNVFTRMFNLAVKNAAECEIYIREVHKSYPQYSYTQVLNACRELCSRHPEASIDTLKYLYSECEQQSSRIVTQLMEIIQEQQEQEQEQ